MVRVAGVATRHITLLGIDSNRPTGTLPGTPVLITNYTFERPPNS